MFSYLPYISSALLMLIFAPLVMFISKKFQILDLPNQRKVHDRYVSRLGGVAMFLSVLISLFFMFMIHESFSINFFWKTILTGSCMAFALGLWDDLKNIAPKKKLFFQFAIAIGTYLWGFRIQEVQVGLQDPLQLGNFSPIVTVLWIVTVMNAINMIDGLDGLAGGFGFLVFLTISILGYLNTNVNVMILGFSCAGACLGFLLFNFYPAKIFMGDAGSMTIGYVLSVLSLSTNAHATPVVVFTPLFLLAFPLIDLVTTITRRLIHAKSNEKKISLLSLIQRTFNADGNHIHHRFLKLGFSQPKIAGIIYGFTILNCFLSVISAYLSFSLLLFIFIFYVWFTLQCIRLLDYEEFATKVFRDQRKEFEQKQKLSTAPSLVKRVQ